MLMSHALVWNERLKQDASFKVLSAAAQQRLIAQTRFVRVLPQQHIFLEQQQLHSVYILLHGKLKVGCLQANGTWSTLCYIEPLNSVNLVACLQQKTLPYDYIAQGYVELAVIPFQAYETELKQQPTALWGLLELLSQRMYGMLEQQRYQQVADLAQRLARQILVLAQDQPLIKLNQQQMADLLQVSRQTLHKHVQQFSNQQLIDWHYSKLKILDRDKLHQLSQIL